MKKHPTIGIVTYGKNDEKRYHLPAVYVEAVRRAGGIPILFPPGEEHASELLQIVDGVILSGGGDIDPALYGGKMHETIYSVDSERDQSEIALAKTLVEGRIPTLCICRGAQVMNVALGGSLIEHLPDEVGDKVIHRDPEKKLEVFHSVNAEIDSKLYSIIGEKNFEIVSWHHQAVRKVAPTLKVVSVAEDGVIEALESTTHPYLIAVQWHPEMSAEKDPLQQKLFDDLVRVAGKSQASKLD